MNLFKSKNKHDAKRQEAALSVILEQADSFFLGDRTDGVTKWGAAKGNSLDAVVSRCSPQ